MVSKKEDFYSLNGVAPPESIPHGTEEDITAKLSGTVHGNWVQTGNVLICRKCPNNHQTEPIPTDQLLIGTDERGYPILKKIG